MRAVELAQLAGQKMSGLLIALNQVVNSLGVALDCGPQHGSARRSVFCSCRGSCEHFAECGIEQSERSIQLGLGDRRAAAAAG